MTHSIFWVKYVDEVLWTGVTAVFLLGAIYVVWSSNFWVCEQKTPFWGRFKWNLFSSAFTWYYLFSRVDLTFEFVDKNAMVERLLLEKTIFQKYWLFC